MRVLLIHNRWSIHGGAEQFFHRVGNILNNEGHEVIYFSTLENVESRDIEVKGGNLFPISKSLEDRSLVDKLIKLPQMIYSKPNRSRFETLIERWRPDVIHAFAVHLHITPSVLVSAKKRNIPVVMSLNDYKHICTNYKLLNNGKLCDKCKNGVSLSIIKDRCVKGSLSTSIGLYVEAKTHELMNIYKSNVTKFLFASEFMLNKTLEFWGKGTFEHEILRNPFVIRHDFNTSFSDKQTHFLFIGRLVEEKGIRVLLQVFKDLKEYKLVIIGQGPLANEVTGFIKRHNCSNIEFAGPKWGDELEYYFSSAVATIVPSIWHENYPYVIFESYQYKRAVIGSKRGGIPELIGNEKLLFDPEDIEDFKSVCKYVMRNPKIIKNIALNKRAELVQKFGEDVFYKRLLNIYESVITK